MGVAASDAGATGAGRVETIDRPRAVPHGAVFSTGSPR